MAMTKRTVLITGCSEGGMGAALAMAFHDAGLDVIATARSIKKMESLEQAGIKTMPLDVLSQSSIDECIGQLPRLDIAVNNAGAGFTGPLADEETNLVRARELFDLNVWAPISMMKACLPLLLKSDKGLIVNHTSVTSMIPVPFNAFYNASKAALGSISDTFRLEIEAFGIRVVELKTGHVRTNFLDNRGSRQTGKLNEDSMYEPARAQVESVMSMERFAQSGMEARYWAKKTVATVLQANPPTHVYNGESAAFAPWMAMLPSGIVNGLIRRIFGLDEVERALKARAT